MFFFFDESGDFAFPDDGFDAYTQAVVICPDSKIPTLDAWAAEKQSEWGVSEFHATELTDDQIWEICRLVRAEGIPGLVQATDTNAVSLKDIEQHRLTQAVKLHENLDAWRAAGGQGTGIPAWFDRLVKANAYSGRVSHAEWVQANSLVDLFHYAINKAVGFHHDEKWRPDFEAFRFILDAKLPGKLAPGEKHLDAVLLGYLASNPGRIQLTTVIEWAQPPVHPYVANFSTDSGRGIDLRKLFGRGLEFESSHNHVGLQLADVLAYTARRRIIDLDNKTIRWAWQTLKPLIRTHDGLYMYLRNFGHEPDEPDQERYRGIQTD
jgi:Protein of unknown function (DUF3800)